MSKITRALDKANDIKSHKESVKRKVISYQTALKDQLISQIGLGNLVLAVILMIIFVSSLLTNFEILSELKKSKEFMSFATQKMDDQRTKMKNLELVLNNNTSKGESDVIQLNAKILDLKDELKSKDKEITEMSIDYNVIRLVVDDLRDTNKIFISKLMKIDEQIDELKSDERIIFIDQMNKAESGNPEILEENLIKVK